MSTMELAERETKADGSLVETYRDPTSGLRQKYTFPDPRNRNVFYLLTELSPGAWSFTHTGVPLSEAEAAEREALSKRLFDALDQTAADFDAEHPDDE